MLLLLACGHPCSTTFVYLCLIRVPALSADDLHLVARHASSNEVRQLSTVGLNSFDVDSRLARQTIFE